MSVEQNNLIEMVMLNKPLTIKEAIRKIIEIEEYYIVFKIYDGREEFKGTFEVRELILIDDVLYGMKKYSEKFIKILIDDKQNKYDYNILYEFEGQGLFNYKESTYIPNMFNKVRTEELTREVLEKEKYLNSLDYTTTSNEGEYYVDIDDVRIHKYMNSDYIYYTESTLNLY